MPGILGICAIILLLFLGQGVATTLFQPEFKPAYHKKKRRKKERNLLACSAE
jgi:hypothetical protein